MFRVQPIQIRMPTPSAFESLATKLKLRKEQAAALAETIKEAVTSCEVLRDETDAATIRDKLKEFDAALAHLAELSASNNFRKALQAMPPVDTIGFLMSPTAALEVPGYKEHELAGPALDRLIARDPPHKPISPAAFDALALLDRQVQLSRLAPNALKYFFDALRNPIQEFLQETRDKGGNRPRSDRDLIIFLLARDARQIIGCEASTSDPFLDLCNQVTAACSIGEDGLEIAVKKCIKKYAIWFRWYQLAPYSSTSRAFGDEATTDQVEGSE